jgi:hypothetical protein
MTRKIYDRILAAVLELRQDLSAELGVRPSELALATYLEALARLGRDSDDKSEVWLAEQLAIWRTDGDFRDDVGNATTFIPALVTVFSAGYEEWSESEYGRRCPYVPGLQDQRALTREIVPYLRSRSNAHRSTAFKIWSRIVSNYFASRFATERAQFHFLKDITTWMQALELSPIGVEEPIEIGDEGRALLDRFYKFAPAGRARAKDAVALLRRAGSYEEAIAGREWMYSERADEYVKANRPWSLGFVVTIWDRYERSRPSADSIAKRERARERLASSIKQVK